jgi:putative transposase
MKTFFSADDYRFYLELLAEYKTEAAVSVWAYCLMPNHVHFVVVPDKEDSLSCLFRRVHREYSRYINFRERWKGHLWQERFHSFVMDEQYLMATVRYVELNPVRAKLCEKAEDWPWSSASSHLARRDDSVTSVKPMLELVDDWQSYLAIEPTEEQLSAIRKHTSSGRPAGIEDFIDKLELVSGRRLRKLKPGPKAAN